MPELKSDAFATGQTLYVLSLAGFTAERPEIQRGIDFLVATQKPDGSWPMISRSTPDGSPGSAKLLTPITCAASSWATLGLARLVPKNALKPRTTIRSRPYPIIRRQVPRDRDGVPLNSAWLLGEGFQQVRCQRRNGVRISATYFIHDCCVLHIRRLIAYAPLFEPNGRLPSLKQAALKRQTDLIR